MILLHFFLEDSGSLATGGLLSSNYFSKGFPGAEAVFGHSWHVFKVAYYSGSLTLSSSKLADPASVDTSLCPRVHKIRTPCVEGGRFICLILSNIK